MSLSTHINAEKVLKASREHSHKHGRPSAHELMNRDKPGHYDLPPVSSPPTLPSRPPLPFNPSRSLELRLCLRTTVCRPLRDGTDSEIFDSEQGHSASRRVRFGLKRARPRWQALVSLSAQNGEARPRKNEAEMGGKSTARERIAELAAFCPNSTNLASFVHTSMDEYGDRLTFENRAINLIGEAGETSLHA